MFTNKDVFVSKPLDGATLVKVNIFVRSISKIDDVTMVSRMSRECGNISVCVLVFEMNGRN